MTEKIYYAEREYYDVGMMLYEITVLSCTHIKTVCPVHAMLNMVTY